MGVYNLWDILLTCAQKMSIQKLSGKILAVDASIWLVKADSIFSEDSQKIRCILQKIVYLRKNNILPVFVFDGIAPAIKRRTLQKRRQRVRQGSQIDVRKKTQIQVMHLIQNVGKQKSQKQTSKDKKIQQKEQQMSQINKLLSNLSQIQHQKSKNINEDDLNKIHLQSQVLIYKYQLFLQDPRLEGLQALSIQEFQQMDIPQKIQYIRLLQNQLYSRQSRRHHKQTLKQLSRLTPEQKIYYEMQKIQKKTKLRQLQDQLYRKTLQNNVKIQNGFQIIQEVRNGKKYIMKRKINQKNDNNSWYGKQTKKEKNNFSQILHYNTKKQDQSQSGDDNDMYGNQPDPFLMDLIGADLTKNKQNLNSNSISRSIQPKLSSKGRKLESQSTQDQQTKQTQPKVQKKKQQKPKKPQDTNKRRKQKQSNDPKKLKNDTNSQQDSQQLQAYILQSRVGQQLQEKNKQFQNINQQSKQKQIAPTQFNSQNNPDNLPNFINYQNLSIRHLQSQTYRNIEFQKLLDMIGIPYIKAPSQAQAQCAYLELQNIVDGVITQDSDVFLFGSKNVFRGVFNDNIRYFSANQIVQKLKLNRQKLIIFAMLLGSDYTQGIKGIGIVNAMEILKIFDNFDKLQQFKKWARYADILHSDQKNTTQHILKQLSDQQEKQFYEFHKRFKNYWYIDDDFPKLAVINAYLKPEVIDAARIKQMKQTNFFALKDFNQEPVRIFMRERLLLTYSETDAYCSYLKKSFKRQAQKKLTDFFSGQQHQFARIRSKRLMKALGRQPNQKQQKKE